MLFCCIVLTVFSCKPESGDKDPIGDLRWALCKMDIKNNPRSGTKNSIDIIGDSAAVHQLSRYMVIYQGMRVNSGFEPFIETYPVRNGWCQDHSPSSFMRDTVNHTFTFMNTAAVAWEVDGDGIPVEGTVRAGYITAMEDLVFCAVPDSTKNAYCDPFDMEPTGNEWGDYHWPWFNDVAVGVELGLIEIDTLGYIPNSQMRANRAHVEQLIREKKYQEILDFFKTGYHIYTCTGEEYRELVRLGIN